MLLTSTPLRSVTVRQSSVITNVVPRMQRVGAARLASSQPQARSAGTPCRAVKLDAELQALLEGAMARSSCGVGDRVGIMGLQFVEEGQKEGCPMIESAIRLSIYLRDYMHSDMRGHPILELGSGIGVAGLTAAAFGASVLLTDLPEVVPVAAKNLAKNADLVRGAGGVAQVAPLDWAAPSGELVQGPWEYVIGSDLVFDERSPDVLAPLLSQLLSSNPSATVFLAHVHRSDAIDDHMTAVFGQHGLAIAVAPRDDADRPEEDISILTVRRA